MNSIYDRESFFLKYLLIWKSFENHSTSSKIIMQETANFGAIKNRCSNNKFPPISLNEDTIFALITTKGTQRLNSI